MDKKAGSPGYLVGMRHAIYLFLGDWLLLIRWGGVYHQGSIARNPLLSTFSLLGAHTGQDGYSNPSLSPHLCVLALVSVCGGQRLVLECLPLLISTL